jgi:hypothetical protein
MEDLPGQMQRVIEGIAAEIGQRIAASHGAECGRSAERESRQLLYDWFLGNFVPRKKRSL